jgi:hypothetical protein
MSWQMWAMTRVKPTFGIFTLSPKYSKFRPLNEYFVSFIVFSKRFRLLFISILYLKHLSSCVIFLQITPHSYFKLIRCTSINAKRRPTRATTMAHARHAGLLTASPVDPFN